jgi:hypothetical protein
MMLSVVVLHPLQLPAGRDLTGAHITEGITWINIFNKSYPSVISTSPILDHERLSGYWVAFAKK